MSKLTLQGKLWTGCGLLLAILLISSSIGLWNSYRSEAFANSVASATHKANLTRDMQLAIEREKVGIRNVALYNDSSYLMAARNDYQKSSSELQTLLSTIKGRELYGHIQEAHTEYLKTHDKILEAAGSGKKDEAANIINSAALEQIRQKLKLSTNELISFYGTLASDAQREQLAAATSTIRWMIAFAIFGLLSGLGVVSRTVKSLVDAIRPMVSAMRNIADHNLAIDDLEVLTQDEIGQASEALNSMKGSLIEMVRIIIASTEQLSAATEEIAASARQSSGDMTTESAQVAMVASAMTEMAASIREVAQSAERASHTSAEAAQAAIQGGIVSKEALASIDVVASSTRNATERILELGASSHKIGAIVSVITEIAEQTNLLALNAAIESARAGEQGRGFAVVAGEVRRLAERTAHATKEIEQMISTIQVETRQAVQAIESGGCEVEKGVEKTKVSGDQLQHIITMVEDVGRQIAQMATAAVEQQSASEQIDASISAISRLTQSSAAQTEQSAQACGNLAELAANLQNLFTNSTLKVMKDTISLQVLKRRCVLGGQPAHDSRATENYDER
jgi:methyl-accepting chemotaxis protein